MNEIFDTTKEIIEWMCNEDRWFYHIQVESKVHVGYTSEKTANSKTMHPSKRRKVTMERISTILKRTTSNFQSETESETQSENESEIEYEESESSEE